MPRDIPVGNGSILVAFDNDYQVREFCYPHVGQENHTTGHPFRFGVWVNGQFRWSTDGWKIRRDYLDDSLVTCVEMEHPALGVRIVANDVVDFHENVYLRKLTVENLSSEGKDVRVFFHQDFHILGNDIGDTAAFRPEANAVVHYKQDRHFLINVQANNRYGVEHFATGNKEQRGLAGTWKDAEDGVLSGNPIAQGSVDSVVAVHLRLGGRQTDSFFYWICAGRDWKEVSNLNRVVLKKTPAALLKRTNDYWKLWVEKEPMDYELLPEKVGWLYRRSLLILRTQIDEGGAILAANDSDVVHFNRDTYSYVWPRDGALASYALDLAGYAEITVRFFNFCARVIEPEGYFLHKYTASGALASSWHPWERGGKAQLPIQEDETALVLWALWKHYQRWRDIEFIKPLYRPVVKAAADFLMNYRDETTGLPLASYDLWEERQGVLTFTVSAVYGGLTAAANFAEGFGERELAAGYREGAERLRQAMDSHLWLESEGRFARMVNLNRSGDPEVDATVDASLYGTFAFGAYEASDPKVVSTMRQVREKLWCSARTGGLARYEDDPYYRTQDHGPGNPWFITTLWLAQYLVAAAREPGELGQALEILQWVADRALPSGVLAEQIDPHTNEPLSVSPLAWSHSTFVLVVREYLNKRLQLEVCPACGLPRISKRKERKAR